MEQGGFDTVEDMLIHALTAASRLEQSYAAWRARDNSELLRLKQMYRELLEEKSDQPPHTGALLIRALQSSPYRELDIEPARFPFEPHARDVTL